MAGCAQVKRGMPVTETRSKDLIAALDEASLSRFHLRAVLVSGMGFFTDAYDLFIIGIASTLIVKQWNLSTGQLSLLNSTMLGAAFLGALVFGRFADLIGRKRVAERNRWQAALSEAKRRAEERDGNLSATGEAA
jgi:hypothetical protein